MLYTPGGSGPGAQAEQVILGIKLDLSYSKPQILRLYADVAYFGHGYFGLARASCGYFGVTPAGLTWSQAALLAGLVQAPSADNPVAHFAAFCNRGRRLQDEGVSLRVFAEIGRVRRDIDRALELQPDWADAVAAKVPVDDSEVETLSAFLDLILSDSALREGMGSAARELFTGAGPAHYREHAGQIREWRARG
jgi:membrane carboxypeptidase/penicillin-binding protein PbpC